MTRIALCFPCLCIHCCLCAIPVAAQTPEREPAHASRRSLPTAAHRQPARRSHLVARRKASDLSRRRRTDRPGSRLGQAACDGEPRQDVLRSRERRHPSRTATIAAATTWPATCGRRTRSICSSTPTAACGCTTCATARAWRSAFPGRRPATIPSSRPTAKSISFVRNHGLAVVQPQDPGTPTTAVGACTQ